MNESEFLRDKKKFREVHKKMENLRASIIFFGTDFCLHFVGLGIFAALAAEFHSFFLVADVNNQQPSRRDKIHHNNF